MKTYNYFYNFGKITASNNYNKNKKKNIKLEIVRNKYDGSLKFKNKVNFNKIKPTHKIFFKEPEFHLKKLSNYLKKFDFKKIVGTTYKDLSLVKIINKKKNLSKFKKNFLSTISGLNFNESPETVLEKFLNLKTKNKKKEKSLIILRHVWEHVFNHKKLIKKIFDHFSNESIFLIEVPCSEYQVKKLDYSMLWEEHVYYFNKVGFINSLNNSKLKLIKFFKFKNFHEDILCAVCVYDKNLKIKNLRSAKMIKYTSNYKNNFLRIKNKLNNLFSKKFNEGLVCYGASHMFNTFVNIFSLEKYISLIIDDNPKKNNKFMLINNVQIKNYEYLKNNLKKNCVFFVNTKNNYFLNKKIKFLKKKNIRVSSIFNYNEKNIL